MEITKIGTGFIAKFTVSHGHTMFVLTKKKNGKQISIMDLNEAQAKQFNLFYYQAKIEFNESACA